LKKNRNYRIKHLAITHLSAIKRCRTAELGGHIDACDECGNLTISYNFVAIGIPKCQGINEKIGFRLE
jgi:hypothetical protein